MKCNGDQTQNCGGANRINIFEFGTVQAAAPSWVAQGCYTDKGGARTLSIGMDGLGAVTNDKCQAACLEAGYTYAGTEYARECFCDSQLRNGGGPAPDGNAQCNMACAGDDSQICGGPDRLTMFKYTNGGGGGASSSAAPSSTPAPSSTVVPPVSSTVRSNTASATASGVPTGWTYKGCYVDGPGFRIMNFQQQDNAQMTIASCSNACNALGYEIAGMEYSTQCFCDHVIRQGGSLATADTQCGMACGGNANEKCGGPDRLSVWSSLATLPIKKKPTPKKTVGNWQYQGCITDTQPLATFPRPFPWQYVNKTSMSAELCLNQCADYGYMAAGIEYGEECYCGDIDGVEKSQSQVAPETDCNMACPGDAEEICGAGLRLTWYKYVSDTPLYVWNYPTGAAAGRYQFLVGGPVIPLISQPAINGKISFLEKKGTGPPNSTGAYEFDPSLSDNIFTTFREMKGIKTDLFCAAGLTLPDKKGRQINIGGWSADSTFGVRLHTPDGVLGTNGTSQWQENVNTLALQTGRWYPSAMQMVNGSILIVGGQSGSNGPPVPNLELLPKAGGLVELDFLRRTDPFNLYPFLVVLPTGGIFIAYYNEARIMNEATFATDKVLPNIPASVNNPKGGRTYPYEGTQVLLPQKAPYTDPLEILICGGAVPNPQWGIDNCVSIKPEEPAPKWKIERMPSRRVMPCIATLPDGTFLILNGGETGEAGFQLGKNPNHNAVLYDSNKPYGQRFSVMANTTISRMYHSEAVLMDDGRVLVSGSDPQDADFPQEYRLEVFMPPYLLSGNAQPSLSATNKDWAHGQTITVTVSAGVTKFSLLGSEASTHGNSMGARILFPAFSCAGTSCTVTAPPNAHVAPPGWYRLFALNGPTPSKGVWIRLGGDPASIGNWPNYPDFQPLPGV
ncbi:copper radical oxidase-like protein [Polyplosphaeria fusca]|uniref:Copper radical oxidase-like protein n=1 Tax=Polyplosphaeria fusca TaxID=682080 RepID=A0A9P4UW60_9PLEO|nr:copper radical oxidase-like protein [Polyplosphaeria fusca]